MVKKNTLLLLACIIWLIAGYNVLRLGIIAYAAHLGILNFILSAVVYFLFHTFVFGKLVKKHCKRINSYGDEKKLFINFFDLKSFMIMAFMMTLGIWLRNGKIVPDRFIAVFYTGLGAALFQAGIEFGINYIKAIKEAK